MGERIKVEGRALAIVVAIWLRRLPKWVWGKDPDFAARVKKGYRINPDDEQDPKRLVAELIAERMATLDWSVTYEQRENGFADRTSPASGARTEPSEPGA
ncbi:hypothetical protein G7077_09265 [Sphingomonas piscis]|uniref:Uncharacterized protein n=1 Tax=Sphingomonas piscis TaxID=2714943 RepID=A0A6G7YQN8_9SPHN|nr:hypothetical protein [Sphingomonas piscis]QIK79053.1 hypothetical protein G7077_09265 [Sphingomonas piscis]